MNKAFVREPDDTGDRYCPKCQSLGEAVGGGAAVSAGGCVIAEGTAVGVRTAGVRQPNRSDTTKTREAKRA